MKRTQRGLKSAVLLALSVLLLLASVALGSTAPAVAQSDNGYDLGWNTVDGGGYTFSTGGGYSLGGTLGQPDAGALSDGDYALAGGFWGRRAIAPPPGYKIYLPIVLKNYR